MTLVYTVAIVLALAAYALMGRLDLLPRVALSLGIFVGLVAVATWLIARVGDDARPGSVEVPSAASSTAPFLPDPASQKPPN